MVGICWKNHFHQNKYAITSAAPALRDCGKPPHSSAIYSDNNLFLGAFVPFPPNRLRRLVIPSRRLRRPLDLPD